MQRFIIVIAVLSLASIGFGEDKPQLKDLKDKVSYGVGLNVGTNFKKQGQDLNPDALLAGLKDGMSGKQPAMSETEMQQTMEAWSKQMEEKQKAAGEKNIAEGAKYLADNKSKSGVKTTASGLQYKVMKEGTGAQPKESDTVKVNYRGTLINGTEFDSSYKRNEPAEFQVNGVIKGWTEGIQLMKQGAKYQFFIPADLAYGAQQRGPYITPNSTLIFEVELLEVKPAAGATPSPTAR
jgi:FKBP-type peptidyl-prolyl cis-trans isomerase FklB